MAQILNNLGFKAMAFFMKKVKKSAYVEERLSKSHILEGQTVLDYACGPGIFTFPIADKVGQEGKVYAADIHPLAKSEIEKKLKKYSINNIEFIQTGCELSLPDDVIDVALLFDCLPNFKDPISILREIHRVLKPNGYLAVDIHHIPKEKGIAIVLESKFYDIQNEDENTNLVLFKPKKI